MWHSFLSHLALWSLFTLTFVCCDQWSGRFLGNTGWDPRVCKSNRLHVDILRFSFIKLGYILQIPLKWSVNFLQSPTSTGSSVTHCRFCLIIGSLLLLSLEFLSYGGSHGKMGVVPSSDGSKRWRRLVSRAQGCGNLLGFDLGFLLGQCPSFQPLLLPPSSAPSSLPSRYLRSLGP